MSSLLLSYDAHKNFQKYFLWFFFQLYIYTITTLLRKSILKWCVCVCLWWRRKRRRICYKEYTYQMSSNHLQKDRILLLPNLRNFCLESLLAIVCYIIQYSSTTIVFVKIFFDKLLKRIFSTILSSCPYRPFTFQTSSFVLCLYSFTERTPFQAPHIL